MGRHIFFAQKANEKTVPKNFCPTPAPPHFRRFALNQTPGARILSAQPKPKLPSLAFNEMKWFSSMKKSIALASLLIALQPHPTAFGAEAASSSAENLSEAAAMRRTVARGKAFLSALNDSQQGKVSFAFDDASQRARWSNLPSGIFQRKGLRFGELTPAQRDAAMAILSAALSPQGYQKIKNIMDADEDLKRTSNGGPPFGIDEFYISFLGAPSETAPWMLQFGGHHLALNLTCVGEKGVLTPSLTAVQPSIFTRDGKTVRPLGAETDKAFVLINALDESQRKQAILGAQMRDLVLGPGQDGIVIQPEGIKGSALTAAQKEMLLDLAGEWTGIIHASAAAEKMKEIRARVDETWFAWSGPTDPTQPAYFRIQGPTLWIEYAPQKLGGDATKHLHTIYRDPTNDYGKKLLHQ